MSDVVVAAELAGVEASPVGGRVHLVMGKGSLVIHSSEEPGLRWSIIGGDQLEVTAIQDRQAFRLSINNPALAYSIDSTNADIWINKSLMVVVEADSANVIADGVAVKSLEINTVSGDVLLNVDAERLAVRTVSSNLILEGKVTQFDGRSVNGSTWLLAEFSEVDVRSRSGIIKADLASAPGRFRVETVDARVDIQLLAFQSGNLISFNHAGETRLALPMTASAVVSARSVHGEIAVEGSTTHARQGAPGQVASRTFGTGMGAVALESFSGAIRISTEQPAPP